MGFTKGGKGKFSKGPSKSFGRSSSFGDKPSFGNRDSSRPFVKKSFGAKGNFELFDTTCGKCGKDCQVPFRPTGGKPVLCRDCFAKKDDYPPKGMSRATMNSSNDESDGLQEINEKLDKIMAALKIR